MSAVRMRTAKAVIVLRVFGLICAGMNARMKFGTLWVCVLRYQPTHHHAQRRSKEKEKNNGLWNTHELM